jgi:hypothetical protein
MFRISARLTNRGPDAVHVVVVLKQLEEFSHLGAFVLAQIRKIFGDIPELARYHCPVVLRQPLRDSMKITGCSRETCAGRAFRNVVVLRRSERLDLLRAGFDRGGFTVGGGIRVMRFNQPDVIEKKLVTARRPELAALEENADLWPGPILVVGQYLDDHGHFARRVTFENNVLEFQFFAANSRAFFYRPLDRVAGHALPARFFDHGRQPRIARRIAAAHLRRDHDLLHELAYRLTLFEAGHFPLRMQPLTTHALF